MNLLDGTTKLDMGKVANEMYEETIKEEDEDFELMSAKYKDMFNATIFNGMTWMSEQNLYSGLKAFQEIDRLVEIIGSNIIRYLQNIDIDTRDYEEMFYTNKGYIEYNDYIFEVEEAYGQGSFTRITLLEGITNENDKIKDRCVKIEDLISWMGNTDEWRIFQKRSE